MTGAPGPSTRSARSGSRACRRTGMTAAPDRIRTCGLRLRRRVLPPRRVLLDLVVAWWNCRIVKDLAFAQTPAVVGFPGLRRVLEGECNCRTDYIASPRASLTSRHSRHLVVTVTSGERPFSGSAHLRLSRGPRVRFVTQQVHGRRRPNQRAHATRPPTDARRHIDRRPRGGPPRSSRGAARYWWWRRAPYESRIPGCGRRARTPLAPPISIRQTGRISRVARSIRLKNLADSRAQQVTKRRTSAVRV